MRPLFAWAIAAAFTLTPAHAFAEQQPWDQQKVSRLSGTWPRRLRRAGDRLPLLYTLLSLSHVTAFRHQMRTRRHEHSDLVAAQFVDIDYDSGAIA